MRVLTRAAVAAACAAGIAVSAAPAGAAPLAGQGCRYYYTSWAQGPNGQTDGFGDYEEGQTDPEGRVCQDGWWVERLPQNGGGDGGGAVGDWS